MKIKTANVRVFKQEGKKATTFLKTVTVKKVFTYADELFFIHRGERRTWTVTHYKTGLRAFENVGALKGIREKFAAAMGARGDTLQKAVAVALERYGAANKIP